MRLTSTLLAGSLLAAVVPSQNFDPVVATDINPASNIVEVNLTADVTTWQYLPGVNTTVWAYNNTIPGPTIEANIGDTLIVHFTNNLPEATTIHWHGIENIAGMDGAHISQLHVPGNGGTFDYKFPLLTEGLYWYHPHVQTYDQVEKGLHGCILVRDPQRESTLGLTGIEEHILVFDDVLLDTQMQVEQAFPPGTPIEKALYQINGRVGNYMLLNGKVIDPSQNLGVTLPVANGKPQRWHAVNVANTTFCRLGFVDSVVGMPRTTKVYQLGADGGFADKPFARLPITNTAPLGDHPGQALLSQMGEGVFLMPGERMDVVFTPHGTPNQEFTITQNDWFRGRHIAMQAKPGDPIMLGDDPLDGRYPQTPYLKIKLQGQDAGQVYTPPAILKNYPTLPTAKGKLPVTFGHSLPDPNTGDVTLFAQAKMVQGQMVPLPTPKINSFEAHDVEVGDTWIWEVTNLTHGDHPFHIHGFFFELLEYEFQDDLNPALNFNFTPYARRQAKDTIRIPARLGGKGTSRTIARLITHFDDTGRRGQVVAQGDLPTFDRNGNYTSGGWLFHCHLLEHSGRGMLSWFEVRDPADPYHLLGHFIPGALGNPSLTARGKLQPGNVVNLDLVNATPNAPVAMIVSVGLARMPFAGGTLVPDYFQGLALIGNADANGETTWPIRGWDLFPSGTDFYFQAGFADGAAAQGFALSNALTFTR